MNHHSDIQLINNTYHATVWVHDGDLNGAEADAIRRFGHLRIATGGTMTFMDGLVPRTMTLPESTWLVPGPAVKRLFHIDSYDAAGLTAGVAAKGWASTMLLRAAEAMGAALARQGGEYEGQTSTPASYPVQASTTPATTLDQWSA